MQCDDTYVQDVIMDHALQTISYIADIGDLLVIMVRLAIKPVASPTMSSVGNASAVSSEDERRRKRVTICCHIFESDEVSVQFMKLKIIIWKQFSTVAHLFLPKCKCLGSRGIK